MNGWAAAREGAMDFEELIEEVAERCDWELDRGEDGTLTVEVETSGGRTQVVVIAQHTDEAEQPLARWWSVIGSGETIDFRKCLEENGKLSYGAFALMGDHLVLVDTQLVQDADPMEVASSITNLAATADRYERALFGVDRF